MAAKATTIRKYPTVWGPRTTATSIRPHQMANAVPIQIDANPTDGILGGTIFLDKTIVAGVGDSGTINDGDPLTVGS